MLAPLLVLGLVGAPPEEPLKVLGEVPPKKGRWRIEILVGADEAVPEVTVCTDAFAEMHRKMSGKVEEGEAGAEGCRTKVLRDGPRRAEIRSVCPGAPPTRVVIEREGAAAWTMRIHEGESADPTFAVRYRHLGPCTDDAPAVELDAESPLCARLRAQVKMLTPAMCAALEGAEKAECEAQITEAKAQLEAMCK